MNKPTKQELPIVSDLYHRATDLFPGYDREEALNLYTAKRMDDSEKLIMAQRRENSKLNDLVDTLADELKSVEQNEAEIQSELDRLKQLARPEEREQLLKQIQQNAANLEQERESIKKALQDHDAEKNEMARLRQAIDQRSEEMKELKNSEQKTKETVADMSLILKGINDSIIKTNEKAKKLSLDLDSIEKRKVEQDTMQEKLKKLREYIKDLYDQFVSVWKFLKKYEDQYPLTESKITDEDYNYVVNAQLRLLNILQLWIENSEKNKGIEQNILLQEYNTVNDLIGVLMKILQKVSSESDVKKAYGIASGLFLDLENHLENIPYLKYKPNTPRYYFPSIYLSLKQLRDSIVQKEKDLSKKPV